MKLLDRNAINAVTGAGAVDVGAGAFSSAAGAGEAAVFTDAVVTGAEIGAAGGPITIFAGALVGGIIAGLWYATS